MAADQDRCCANCANGRVAVACSELVACRYYSNMSVKRRDKEVLQHMHRYHLGWAYLTLPYDGISKKIRGASLTDGCVLVGRDEYCPNWEVGELVGFEASLYTDGSCNPNPGPGGWGCIIRYQEGRQVELSGGESETTNNRMELMAVVEGLRSIPVDLVVRVVSDSEYVCKAINENWLRGWMQHNWRTTSGTPVKNKDLWLQLKKEISRQRSVRFVWVKGHNGHPMNERADELAGAQTKKHRPVV